MNLNTKILLLGIITGAVAVQLLSIIFRHSLAIGGEIFVLVLVIVG